MWSEKIRARPKWKTLLSIRYRTTELLYCIAGTAGEGLRPELDHVAERKLSFTEEDDNQPLAFLTSHNSLDDLLGEFTVCTVIH